MQSTSLVAVAETTTRLPDLVRSAASKLARAETAAEVLEAKEAASLAYDAAKRAGRLQRAKRAHDDVIAAVYRAQADALEIESAAKRRLADEYDAAQERGEVNRHGGDRKTDDFKLENVKLEGFKPHELHEARQLRDAEIADPGITRRSLDSKLDAGEEPTKAALREAVLEAASVGLSGKRPAAPSRKNPHYQPDAKWDAMLAVSAGCRDMMDRVRDLTPDFILSGFVDDGQRQRNLASIRECRDFLTLILEAADADGKAHLVS